MTQPDVITNPCGCNQPHAVHERGDQAFCRAWQAAGQVVQLWRAGDPAAKAALLEQPGRWPDLAAALDELEEVWPA